MLEAHRTFLVCILDLMQPISTALSAGSKPSGVETLFIVNRTTFWIAFPSEKKNQQLIIIKILGGKFFFSDTEQNKGVLAEFRAQ